jgi:hypothetical protein
MGSRLLATSLFCTRAGLRVPVALVGSEVGEAWAWTLLSDLV